MVADVQTMAYAGNTPWHGLGNKIDASTNIDEWKIQSGLTWLVDEHTALWMTPHGTLKPTGRKALVRHDTENVLGVVTDKYHVVQPGDVLEFYRQLAEKHDLSIETAGALKGGKRIWALAKTQNEDLRLPGDDSIKDYVLFGTSYDGTMSTFGSRTSVRVVCSNTLAYAIGNKAGNADVRVPHLAKVDFGKIQDQLGLIDPKTWVGFGERARELTKRRVTMDEAVGFFLSTLYGTVENDDGRVVVDADITNGRVQNRVDSMVDLFLTGPGAAMESAQGTAWGLVNAITRHVDHAAQEREEGNRLDSAWFGNGANMKRSAWENAQEFVEGEPEFAKLLAA